MKRVRLWEVEHRYGCEEANYYAPGNQQPHEHYENVEDFLAEEGEADLDYNLVFRWDWDTDYDGKCTFKVFILNQRKGLYRWVTVEVKHEDEKKIVEYLEPRWEHLKKLWEPLI